MGRAVSIVSACALLACVAATAAMTPSSYRAQVNGICRTYTPWLKKEKAAATRAQAAKNMAALGIALGQLQRLGLGQDQRILAVPVPAAMRARMTPILSTIRQIDSHVRNGAARAAAGDGAGWSAEISAAAKLSEPLSAKFDAAGLRDCGSNQN